MTKKIFLFIVVLLWAIFALGCSSGWGSVAINATNFPDEAFRSWIRGSWYYNDPHFDKNSDGILDNEEISNIKSLYVGKFNKTTMNTVTLEGIQFFTSLESLTIDGCPDLVFLPDISNNIHLREIEIADSPNLKFKSLDARKLSSLEKVRIYCSEFESLNASGLSSLKEISCTYINELDVSGCTSLKELGVSGPLKKLDIKDLKNLEILFCGLCEFTEFNISNFSSLYRVDIMGTKLNRLIISNCNNLLVLACSENPNLQNLVLSNLPSLNQVQCNSNGITHLNIPARDTLESLSCYNNKIKTLDFSGYTALQTLSCGHNKLSSLNLSGCTSLTNLYCYSNDLEVLNLDGCSSLVNLDCQNNKLAALNLGDCSALFTKMMSSAKIEHQFKEIKSNKITRTGTEKYPYQFDFNTIMSKSDMQNVGQVLYNFTSNDLLDLWEHTAFLNKDTGILSFSENPETFFYNYDTGHTAKKASRQLFLPVDFQVIPATSSDPEITTTSLPDGKIGETYNKTLEATGTTPFNWSTYDELPDGLTLNSDGKISGTPNESGTFLISVEVSNDVGTDIKAFELLIKANSEDKIEPPIITTNTLPDGVVSEDYMKTLDAYGTTPIIWSVIKNNLPDGLILSSGGEISGTPLKQGIYNFTVQASNDAGINTKDLKIIINLPEINSSDPEPEPTPVITIVKPEITTSSIPNGKVNTAYSPFQLTATGTTPITWEAIDLPSGITCSKSGVLSGTPTRAGNFANVVIIASNSAGSTLKSFIFRIEEATATVTRPSITTQNKLPSATVSEFYRQQFSASGTTPITWSASGLPKGLNFNSSGLMSGIPETSGKFNFSVSAKNSAGTDTKTFSITINAASTPTPTPEPDPTPEPINNDDFDEEFANNMREFLGKENSTPVKNLSSENASINNNVEAPIYWDDENNGEIIALLPEIIVDTDGIYLLRVSFDETVEAGSNLKWYSFAQNANSASAKISEIEGEDYVFLDDDGNKIISPTINALNYMNVAVFFEANKKYSPVISAISKKNNNSNNNANNNNNNTVTSSGGGGGGCNFNFGILSAILALTFLIRNVKIQKQ